MKGITRIILTLLLVVGATAIGAGCDSNVSAKEGTIEVRVTDAPPEYDIATIDIVFDFVAVHRVNGEDEGEWMTIQIVDGEFDLLQLQAEDLNGLLAQSTEDMTGRYTQLRIIIQSISVTLNGEGEVPEILLPSEELKFNRPFEVTEGETTILLLDFDAAESIVTTGAGKLIFKPVVRLSIEQIDTE